MQKKWIFFAIKLALSVFLIWFLASNIDFSEALNRASKVSASMLLLSALIIVFQLVLGTFRWMAALIAIGSPLSFIEAFRIYYIGIFFNQVLPSSVGGDGVRMYRAYKAGLSVGNAITGVMLERMATVLALILLLVVLQPFLMSRIGDQLVGWLFPVLTVGAVGGLAFLMLLDRLPSPLQRWRMFRGVSKLSADTRLLFLHPKHAFLTLTISMLGHINLSVAVYVIAIGLGIEVTVFDCLILVPPVVLITTLPISIAGWGVREGAMVAAFGFIGVPAESSLVLSILLGLLAVAVSLPGGLIWLLSGYNRKNLDGDEAFKKAMAVSTGEKD